MRVTRAVSEVRRLLNRPDEDDLFSYPGDYIRALERAVDRVRRKVVAAYPEALYETALVTSTDGGETYVLPDDHLGEMEIWTPPGPPTGRLVSEVLPERGASGVFVQGRTIRFTRPTPFHPGIYVRWVPATTPAFSMDPASEDSLPLPSYLAQVVLLEAAYDMAKTPGVLLDAEQFRVRAIREWSGDRDDPSDTGALGILARQSVTRGHQAVSGPTGRPWYRFV